MDTPSTKDYVDAKVEILATEAREYYAKTDARLAEMDARVVTRISDMENRVMRGQAEMIKWCVGIVFAGMTINISVSAYLYTSVLNRVDGLAQEVRALRTTLIDQQPKG